MHPPMIARFIKEVDDLQSAHYAKLQPLYTRHQQLEKNLERARRLAEAQFPKTIAEFNSIHSGKKLRVARFLMSKTLENQEKMLDASGWAWAAVKPLMDIYKSDVRCFLCDCCAPGRSLSVYLWHRKRSELMLRTFSRRTLHLRNPAHSLAAKSQTSARVPRIIDAKSPPLLSLKRMTRSARFRIKTRRCALLVSSSQNHTNGRNFL
jgi:hypothetical protein